MRTCVFIDGGYIDKILELEFNRARIDYLAFSNYLCESDERIRTYYYHCPPYQSDPPTQEERDKKRGYDQFKYNLLRLPRFEVREGKLVMRRSGPIQKGVDVLMAVDLVRLSATNQIQKAVLVSGDNDLTPAIIVAKESMVITKLYYSPRSFSGSLYEACDDREEITQELINRVLR